MSFVTEADSTTVKPRIMTDGDQATGREATTAPTPQQEKDTPVFMHAVSNTVNRVNFPAHSAQ
jgi:hypothetical protein